MKNATLSLTCLVLLVVSLTPQLSHAQTGTPKLVLREIIHGIPGGWPKYDRPPDKIELNANNGFVEFSREWRPKGTIESYRFTYQFDRDMNVLEFSSEYPFEINLKPLTEPHTPLTSPPHGIGTHDDGNISYLKTKLIKDKQWKYPETRGYWIGGGSPNVYAYSGTYNSPVGPHRSKFVTKFPPGKTDSRRHTWMYFKIVAAGPGYKNGFAYDLIFVYERLDSYDQVVTGTSTAKGTDTGSDGTIMLPPDIPFVQLPPPGGAGMGDWKVDYGKYEVDGGVINASPAGDGKTSYYIAPGAFIGNWSGRRGLVFDKKSWGGTYYGPDSYAAYGDVVIKSGNKSARYDINRDHSKNWRTYRIALSDRGWIFSGGATSLADIVPNVTELKIRAEYGAGTDYSALRRVKFAYGAAGTTPMTHGGVTDQTQEQPESTTNATTSIARVTWDQILSGKWGSSTGKGYELKSGDFFRNGYINMRLSCRQNIEKRTVTPVFDCSGERYNNKGEAQGAYEGKLYFLRGEKWYLEGKYNYDSKPDSWYGWNFSKKDASITQIGAGYATISPGLTAAEILNGQWGSSTGKGYELKNGDFHRNGYINMRLSCRQNLEKRTVTPVFDCSGDWYNSKGEAEGAYEGKLYFLRGEKWHLEGKYKYDSHPDSWYAWNFSKKK